MTPPRETPKEAGLKYVEFRSGLHIFQDVETGEKQGWVASKHFAGYALEWRNTHLEFVTSNV